MKYEQEIEKYVEYRNELGKVYEDSKLWEDASTLVIFFSLPLLMLSFGGMLLAEASIYASVYDTIFKVLIVFFTIMFLGSIVTLLVSEIKYNKEVKEVERNKEVSDEIEQLTSGLSKRTVVQILNEHLETIESTKKVYITNDRKLKMVDFKGLQG